MTNEELLGRIQGLVEEEHALREGEGPVDQKQLAHLEETLDQCWDLLRQRRARREYGQDPQATHVRNVDTVEDYQQ